VCLEAIEQLRHRGARVRFATRTRSQLDQRVRLFRAGRQDAARSVILERSPDQLDAVGQQRGCKRVACVAGELFAVELK
jgi:hypothetical protein